MNRDHDPKRHRTVPEAHIQILKRQNDQAEGSGTGLYGFKSSEATVRRASLAQEVKDGNVAFPTLLKNPDSISNMEKGTTFAARARAAELNSARAAAAAKDAMASGEELTPRPMTDEVPEVAPVSLGSLKFTLPKTKGLAKASKSHNQFVSLPDIPANFNLANPDHKSASSSPTSNFTRPLQKSNVVTPTLGRGDEPSQSIALGGRNSILNQQAIRQKVREVSAKQQSINDKNEHQDEPCRQPVQDSNSVSPFSSHGSKSSQIHGVKKAELNTQHIRELRREAEKQGEAVQSYSQGSPLLLQRSDSDDTQSLIRSPTVSSKDRPIEDPAVVRQSNNTQDSHSEHKSFVSAISSIENQYAVPVQPQASFERDTVTFPHSGSVSISNEHPNIRSPQTLSPSQRMPTVRSEWGRDMSFNPSLPRKPDYSATGYAQLRNDHDFSSQALMHLPRDSTFAQHQHRNLPMTSPQATSSATRMEDEDDQPYKSSYMRDTERFGVGIQAPPSISGSGSKGPAELIQIQSPSQSSGTENQSPYEQQNISRSGPQSHSIYTQQTQDQSILGQTRPKAMDKFADIPRDFRAISTNASESQANEDPFLDTAQSSSTVTPATHTNLNAGQLRATSPAFVPSSLNAGLVPSSHESRPGSSVQAKAPLPAVKGTDRQHRSRRRSHRSDVPLTTWDQHKEPFSVSTVSAAYHEDSRNKHTEALHKVNEDVANSRNQTHGLTSGTAKTSSLRDPMPYTGFSSSISKKDQLIGSLNKTIDEAKAKGALLASNRSVLFDPVASGTPASGFHSSSSTSGKDYDVNSSNVRDTRLKPEAPTFDFHKASESARGTPECDRNILKDSEPLPPYIRQQNIETKSLSSPEEGFGYGGHRRGYSGTAPRYPPGLSQSTNPFNDGEFSNQDGFWDDSLAVNSGNTLIEQQVEELGTGPLTWSKGEKQTFDPKKNAWFEEQKRLLCPKVAVTAEQLDDAAKEWFASGDGPMEDHVKSLLRRSEGLAPLPPGSRYWEKLRPQEQSIVRQAEYNRPTLGSRQAPIGSERTPSRSTSQPFDGISLGVKTNSWTFAAANLATSSLSGEEIRRRAAIDVMGPVLANLASYQAGEAPGPCQRYSQPPAWCIDHTEAGRKSFLNDNWGDVPKRVGRDPRYQLTVHEGRSTYFEDPNSTGRRDLLTAYQATSGWVAGHR